MRRIVLLAVGLSLPLSVTAPARPKARAASAAVVADVVLHEDNPDPAHRAKLLLVGGWSPTRGWLSGEQARGVMPRDARLSLYQLTRGVVGEAQASGGERVLANDTEGGGLTTGIEVRAKLLRLDLPAGQERRTGALAVWRAPGTAPLRWVKGRKLDPHDPSYRRLVGDWLKGKKVAKSTVDSVSVDSAVAADINGDGREEIFLGFGSAEHREKILGPGKPTPTDFSYLIMRYTPHGSRQPKIAVVAQSVPFDYDIRGFCDLDGDGWAELIAHEEITDFAVSVTYHWNGRGFERTEGWSFSV